MRLKLIGAEDAEALWRLQKALDAETSFMMYEPDERTFDLAATAEEIRRTDFLVAAEVDGRLAGYLSAQRGAYRRVRHVATVVIGVLAEFQRQGIGRRCFAALDAWALEQGVRRLELTVESTNSAAIALYTAAGFTAEGVRRESMRVGGDFVDELSMAKLIPPPDPAPA